MKKNTVLCLGLIIVLGSLIIGCQTAAQRPMRPDQPQQQDTPDRTMTETERRDLANRLSRLAEEVEGVERAAVIVSTIDVTQGDRTIDSNRNPVTPGTTTNNPRVMPGQPRNDMNNPNMPRNDMNNPNMPRTINPGTDMDNANDGIIVMVGLSLNKNVDTADKTNEIKRTVANRLRANDRRISQVLVTTDPNLITRINDVANGIIQGRPIQTFERDINDIGRDLQMQQPAF
ncbi:MAG: hypothetical protein GX550_04530 [Syntrophomonadaceae bacterium]|nr:hypothetical protein [Syntrophomonadaceae bacterium]